MNVELRKWTLADKEKLAEICNAADRTYLSDRMPSPYTVKDAEWWLHMVLENEGKEGLFRAITVDGEIIGNISVEKKQDVYRKDAEIGYFLDTSKWSKGIMTKAAEQMCAIAFEELDIIRITGLAYEPNMASRRVLEKNGFELEGVMKNAVVKGGNVYHLYIYGKVKQEL